MNHWSDAHAPMVDWLRAHGYVQERPPDGNWCIAWAMRGGFDFTDLEFWPWTNRDGIACVNAIVGHHASGSNPRLVIGTCESVADVAVAHEMILRLNGYPSADAERQQAC